MLRFLSFAVLYLVLKSAHSLCPDSEYVEPCECFSGARIIRCNNLNEDIKLDFGQFKDMSYISFIIHNYTKETLDLKGLQEINFERLFIENSTLKYIKSSSPDKFIHVTNSIVIRNNKNLVFDGVLRDTIALFDQIVTLSVENNPKLASFSFVANPTFPKLNQIMLQNNKLKSFSFDSITSIKTLKQINLDHNEIDDVTIDLKAFNRNLVINVNYNVVKNLKITQTDSDTLSEVSIYLENNQLTKLEQNKVFYFVKQKNNRLYLRDNPFQCTCDYTTTTWIVSYNLQSTIHDMTCASHSNRNIFEVGFVTCTGSLSSTPKEEVITAEPTTAPDEPATQTENEPSTAPNEPATQTKKEPSTAPDEPETQTVSQPTTAPPEPKTQLVSEPTTV